MHHDSDLGRQNGAGALLAGLTQDATTLGHHLVDIAGFLSDLDARGADQVRLLADVRQEAERLRSTTAQMGHAARRMISGMNAAETSVASSVDTLAQSSTSSRALAEWVQTVRAGSDAVDDMLSGVRNSNTQIAAIAAQVNILAMNAKIEAARAGQAGTGFAIVAEAINELSHKTSAAAEDISKTVGRIGSWMDELRQGAVDTSRIATELLGREEETDAAFASIGVRMQEIRVETEGLGADVQKTETSVEQLTPAVSQVAQFMAEVARGVTEARKRSDALIDVSEGVMQKAVGIGSTGADAPMIRLAQDVAGRIGMAFEEALAAGRISLDRLFDTRYVPIPGTDPQQVKTGFTDLTDAVLPALQEPILRSHPNVVFCAAVDRNGYLPTHNAKFSQPQSADPVWNAAHCRNRRIFDDRVGLKAGRSTAPFLLQIYRRDMGGGTFAMMKDLSAPITVRGRHWGGLRMAYRL